MLTWVAPCDSADISFWYNLLPDSFPNFDSHIHLLQLNLHVNNIHDFDINILQAVLCRYTVTDSAGQLYGPMYSLMLV